MHKIGVGYGLFSKLFGKKKTEEAAKICVQKVSKKDFVMDGNVLVRYCGDGGDVTLPETIKEIGEEA